ncbi:predicted protein [Naegleria gruberi]|uniref:Predicted protein n=1 Tax=Naegleria gruberi TaxID=5762 RepID=D2VL34_NAEGR|nr:uncharacterized protein NAEGRDRAFT_50453 [Naegleria gruberi]EFC42468.1 predicted protein [Naegleria gruberi]|eukprot:XP_002675212.1 predicted protein [Naegleria gruberi strain NEG-M]
MLATTTTIADIQPTTTSRKRRFFKRNSSITPSVSSLGDTDSNRNSGSIDQQETIPQVVQQPELTSSKKAKKNRRFIKKQKKKSTSTTTPKTPKKSETTKKRKRNNESKLDKDKNPKEATIKENNGNNEMILLAKKAKLILSKINNTPLLIPEQKPITEKFKVEGEISINGSFNTNSQVRDDLFIETLLKNNHQKIPEEGVVWPRIRKIIATCYNGHMLNGKKFFSGEDVCVASLLNWLIELVPEFSSSNVEIFKMERHSLRKAETTRVSLVLNMSNFSLSFDGISKHDFEIAAKLVELLTQLFYSNLKHLIVIGIEKRHSLFTKFMEKDTNIPLSIKERICKLILENNSGMISLELYPKLAKEFKNYSKLLACFFAIKQDEFRHFSLNKGDVSKWPCFAKYSLFKHVFSLAMKESEVCSFLQLYFQLKKESNLAKMVQNQLKILRKGNSDGESTFELCIIYLILKASKKIRENSKEETNELKLSIQEFQDCKEFLVNEYDSIIENSPTYQYKKCDAIFGIKMIRKLRKFIE